MASKKYTLHEVQKKLEHYCAYQERCHAEVRAKIHTYQVYGQNLEEIISHLIQENFLNEERYAKAFVSGKFRIKHWGKTKIIQALKSKNISPYLIDKAIQQIDEETYTQTLKKLLVRKSRLLKEPDTYHLKQKLFKYAYQKGYSTDLIIRQIASLID